MKEGDDEMMEHFEKPKAKLGSLLTLAVLMTLLLAACAGAQAAPQATEPPASPIPPPTVPQPTAAPMQEMVTPSVSVMDQEIDTGTVTVPEVVSDGAGWLVIHADQDGAPGQVIDHTAVSDGANENVTVEIDPQLATPTLYAMLHTDSGEMGTHEFPGGDPPVQVNGEIVVKPFMVTGLPVTPSVAVTDQEVKDGTVTVPEVVSDGQGWIVIHREDEGKPGAVIGHTAVSDGANENVTVEIDVAQATQTLFAMLHTDTGEVGSYEFPGGDPPVMVHDQIVVEPFEVTGAGRTAAQQTIKMVGASFDPKEITVPVGTTVVWENSSSLRHTVTADDGSFDSGPLGAGDTFEFTFTQAGVVPYHCEFHGAAGGVGMSGTITVTSP
jgi:plastocyanin